MTQFSTKLNKMVVKIVLLAEAEFLGKGPKIKKHESTVFDHTPLTPSPPPPNLNYGLFTQNF